MTSPIIPARFPGRFLDKPSPEVVRAYEHLAPLADKDDDVAGDVFAAAVAPHWRTGFARRYGVTESKGRLCIQRLLGKHCALGRRFARCPCSPPADDHPSLWMHEGKPVIWVSQPYGLYYTLLRDILAFCDTTGLEVDIDTWPAWHCPGSTLALLYARPGVLEQLQAAARSPRKQGV